MIIGLLLLIFAMVVTATSADSHVASMLYYDADYVADDSYEEETDTTGEEDVSVDATASAVSPKRGRATRGSGEESLSDLASAAKASDPVSKRAQQLYDSIQGDV